MCLDTYEIQDSAQEIKDSRGRFVQALVFSLAAVVEYALFEAYVIAPQQNADLYERLVNPACSCNSVHYSVLSSTFMVSPSEVAL